MKQGDRIHLKNGTTATITSVQMGDFIGDPKTIVYQYVENGKVEHGYISETELKEVKK